MRYGIDLSKWNEVDWELIEALAGGNAGDKEVEFVLYKRSQGIWEDPKADSHEAGTIQVGVETGEYHFYDPFYTIEQQVTTFMSKRSPRNLKWAFDFEKLGVRSKSQLQADSIHFCREAHTRTQLRGLFYSNYNLLLNYIKPVAAEIVKYADIWLAWPQGAGYESTHPNTPGIDGYPSPKVWQYDWWIRPSYATGSIDHNRFEGGDADWIEFWAEVPSELTLEEKVELLWRFHRERGEV